MLPPTETFIELESRLSRILLQRWRATVAAGWPAIKASWDAGNYETAISLVGGLQPGPLHQAQERRIRVLMNAMLAYGAEHVSSKARRLRLAPTASQEPVDLGLRQLAAMEDETAAFAVRMLQAEARRQQLISNDPSSFEALFHKADDALGPSSYRARNIITSGGRWSSDLSANLSTSRLVGYGSLDAMRASGIRRYMIRVTLDARTSQICRNMRGRVFEVSEGFDVLDRALRATDSDAIRVAQPWIPSRMADQLPNMSNAELVSKRMITPPFHPRCRSVLVPAGPVRVARGGRGAPAQQHPLHDPATLDDATSLPLYDLVDGGGIMRAVRGVGHQTPLHSWEIDALGDLIGLSLSEQAITGRISLAQAQEIVTGLVRTAVPAGPAQAAVLDALMTELRGAVGNTGSLFAPTH